MIQSVERRRSYFAVGQASRIPDRRPYDAAGVTAELPAPSALLCALMGQCATDTLTNLAYTLAGVHRDAHRHPHQAKQLRLRRVALIAEIDAWTVRSLPNPAVGARPNPNTLGQTVDRIAAVAARAFELLMTDDPAGDRLHAQWTRLAELEVAYGDLVRDLRDGRRYLPTARLYGIIRQDGATVGPRHDECRHENAIVVFP
jgi:Protein of unknown function (DUF4254)